jgi:hypothetical protein
MIIPDTPAAQAAKKHFADICAKIAERHVKAVVSLKKFWKCGKPVSLENLQQGERLRGVYKITVAHANVSIPMILSWSNCRPSRAPQIYIKFEENEFTGFRSKIFNELKAYRKDDPQTTVAILSKIRQDFTEYHIEAIKESAFVNDQLKNTIVRLHAIFNDQFMVSLNASMIHFNIEASIFLPVGEDESREIDVIILGQVNIVDIETKLKVFIREPTEQILEPMPLQLGLNKIPPCPAEVPLEDYIAATLEHLQTNVLMANFITKT